MLKLKWPRMNLHLDLVSAVQTGLDAIGEVLAGTPGVEARIRRDRQARDNWPPLGRAGMPLGGARRADMFTPGASASLSLEAQRRFEKLERELREARMGSAHMSSGGHGVTEKPRPFMDRNEQDEC